MLGQRYITAVMACDERGLIGNGHQLPAWDCPQDLAHFRQLTAGQVLLMGKGTFTSLPSPVLQTRTGVILGKPSGQTHPNACFVQSIDDMAGRIRDLPADKQLFAIGGAQFITTLFEGNLIDSFILSRINGTYEGDTYLPASVLEGVMGWPTARSESYDGFTIYHQQRPVQN